MLAEEGAHVVVPGRSLKKVNEALAALPGKFTAVEADLGTADGARKLIAAVPDTDILVNNLGIYESKDFTAITGSTTSRSICSAASAWRGIISPPCSSATGAASSSSPAKPPPRYTRT